MIMNNRNTKYRVLGLLAMKTVLITAGTATVLATNNPIAVVNNLSDFIFNLIRAIGLILLGFGIL